MAPIELKGGLIVDAEAIAVALMLELAGITLTAKDGVLTASPKNAVTPHMMGLIRQWKLHLLAIHAYEPPAIS